MKYEDFADYLSKGEYKKMTAKEKLQYIFDTEEGFYVPFEHMKDYDWIKENIFKIKSNSRHPLANVILELLLGI